VTIFNRLRGGRHPLTPEAFCSSRTQIAAWDYQSKKNVLLRDLSEKTKAGLLEFQRLPELTEHEVMST